MSVTGNTAVSGITPGVDDAKKNYLQYIAGAIRQGLSDSTATSKKYTSQILINYNKVTNDTKVMARDTLDIVYSWTSLFNVSSISINKKLSLMDPVASKRMSQLPNNNFPL